MCTQMSPLHKDTYTHKSKWLFRAMFLWSVRENVDTLWLILCTGCLHILYHSTPNFLSSCNWVHCVLIFPINKSHRLCPLWYKSLRPRPAYQNIAFVGCLIFGQSHCNCCKITVSHCFWIIIHLGLQDELG